MKRNPSIELYRCLLMFGIVLLHCTGYGVTRAPWLGLSLNFCVVGFVFISGYFGIKFSWRKLLSLYCIALFCAAVGALVQWATNSDAHIVANAFMYMKWFWFLHAYAVLMLVSPILNLAFKLQGRDLLMALMPTFFLVFVWSYCFQIGHLKPYVFETAGLGAHTPLTLIGIYLAARWFRVSELETRITDYFNSSRFARHHWLKTPVVFWLAILPMLPIAAIGLAPYNSIFAFILAASFFLIFKNHVNCGSWPCILAPSMFSIYLLHSTAPGLALIRHFVTSTGWGKYLQIVSVAIVLFAICLAIDMLRRLIWTICARKLKFHCSPSTLNFDSSHHSSTSTSHFN